MACAELLTYNIDTAKATGCPGQMYPAQAAEGDPMTTDTAQQSDMPNEGSESSSNSSQAVAVHPEDGPVVVGIGASAGGLEALRPLVGNLPDTTNMCYVITQHMAPKHKSLLDQLLSRETGLEVREVQDGDPVIANMIFVTPPGSDVVVRDGRLRLHAPQAVVGPKPSVDIFFTSLAEELGARAIGIVLSGTGSDGAYGVHAIRAAGGVVIAQCPETAKYDGMPNAAIETGCVDIVMPPVEIAQEISSIACFPRAPAEPEVNLQGDQAIDMILKKLQQHTGVDFVNYKKTTIARRLDQRLATARTKNLEEYYAYIMEHPSELDQLCKNILISVTAFFRDKQAFEALGEALKRLLANKEPGDMLRIWGAGLCHRRRNLIPLPFCCMNICASKSTLTKSRFLPPILTKTP